MSNVVTFVHRGFPVALPANQVVEVGEIPSGAKTIELWDLRENAPSPEPGNDTEGTKHLGVHVRTETTDAWIASGSTRIGPLSMNDTMPLTDVLGGLLRRIPHVVGAASTAKGLLWLVDLRRRTTVD